MPPLKEIKLGIDAGAVPGEVLDVYRGETVRVTGTYNYQGPTLSGLRFRAAIGSRGILGFDEILSREISFNQPLRAAPGEEFNISADIPITTAIDDGVYDVYCKISNIPGEPDLISADVTDGIRVVVAAQFRNLSVVSFTKI
jgi:hypothetical protein